MRIFISHGMDKEDAADVAFLEALNARLRTADADGPAHDVLLDLTRLEPGWVWADMLHEWLGECQAAVLLLTPRGLERDWVLKEATILAHRKALDPGFPVLTVLRGVAPETLNTGRYSPLCLTSIQAMKSATTAAEVARIVKGALAQRGVPPRTPLEELRDALKNWIQDADAASLEQLCERITGKPVLWSPGDSRPVRLAREIALAIVQGRLGGVATLATLIGKLRLAKLSAEAAQNVLNLACSQWVSPEAAAVLAAASGQNRYDSQGDAPLPPVAVALNCSMLEFSADRYVRRVRLPLLDKHVIYTVEGGWSDAMPDEVCARVRSEYRRVRGYPKNESDAKTDERLAKSEQPIFFAIPGYPDPDLVKRLHATFPRVTFVFGVGEWLDEPLPASVLPLMPPLDIDLEEKMYDDYTDAKNAIG